MIARALLTLTALCVWSANAAADQTDGRLPGLFTQLRMAADIQTAREIEQTIWKIWIEKPDNLNLQDMLERGTSAMTDGRYREAEAIFSFIIKKDADYSEAWNKRATLYFLMGAYQLSKQDIAQTIAREPNHFGALSGLGLVEMHLGNYQAALNAYQQAATIHPFIEGYDEIIRSLERMSKGTAL